MSEGTKARRQRALILGLVLAASGLTTGCMPGTSAVGGGFPNTGAQGQSPGIDPLNMTKASQDVTKVDKVLDDGNPANKTQGDLLDQNVVKAQDSAVPDYSKLTTENFLDPMHQQMTQETGLPKADTKKSIFNQPVVGENPIGLSAVEGDGAG